MLFKILISKNVYKLDVNYSVNRLYHDDADRTENCSLTEDEMQ